MTDAVVVRRIRLHEWREVRDLRIAAVSDDAASVAFLTTSAEELARTEAFWRERAAGGALSEEAAQFVAETDGTWVGTATALVREGHAADHHDRTVERRRVDVVGVYVAPDHRGSGVLELLVAAVAAWAAARGVDALTLDVHTENLRAQAAYRRLGFAPTGVTFTSAIGPELEMRRPL